MSAREIGAGVPFDDESELAGTPGRCSTAEDG